MYNFIIQQMVNFHIRQLKVPLRQREVKLPCLSLAFLIKTTLGHFSILWYHSSFMAHELWTYYINAEEKYSSLQKTIQNKTYET